MRDAPTPDMPDPAPPKAASQGPSPRDAASHPPLAPRRKARASRPAGDPFLDDRGRPLILADVSTLRNSLYNNQAPFPWRRVLAFGLMLVLAAYFVLSMCSVVSFRPNAVQFLVILTFIAPATLWRRGGTRAIATRDLSVCSSLVRAGRCGGCGFSLEELVEDADGRVACSECGAAWHVDRWRDAPATSITQARTLVDGPAANVPTRAQMDDRGVRLAEELTWEPKWYPSIFDGFIRDTVAPDRWRVAREFHAEGTAQLVHLRVRNGLWVAGAIGLCVTVLGTIGFDSVDASAYVVIGLFAFFAFVIALAIANASVDTRGLSLKHGLCPACGELLDLAQPPKFDGCIQCTKCASAWNMGQSLRAAQPDSTRGQDLETVVATPRITPHHAPDRESASG